MNSLFVLSLYMPRIATLQGTNFSNKLLTSLILLSPRFSVETLTQFSIVLSIAGALTFLTPGGRVLLL